MDHRFIGRHGKRLIEEGFLEWCIPAKPSHRSCVEQLRNCSCIRGIDLWSWWGAWGNGRGRPYRFGFGCAGGGKNDGPGLAVEQTRSDGGDPLGCHCNPQSVLARGQLYPVPVDFGVVNASEADCIHRGPINLKIEVGLRFYHQVTVDGIGDVNRPCRQGDTPEKKGWRHRNSSIIGCDLNPVVGTGSIPRRAQGRQSGVGRNDVTLEAQASEHTPWPRQFSIAQDPGRGHCRKFTFDQAQNERQFGVDWRRRNLENLSGVGEAIQGVQPPAGDRDGVRTPAVALDDFQRLSPGPHQVHLRIGKVDIPPGGALTENGRCHDHQNRQEPPDDHGTSRGCSRARRLLTRKARRPDASSGATSPGTRWN